MARVSLKLPLLLAATVCPLSRGQTIVGQDGQVMGANTATVAPAAKPGTLQLTDAGLANLTAHKLSGIELFGFGDAASLSARLNPIPVGSCKAFPGDAAWPSPATWAVFNLLTGGAQIKTVPIGAVCYPDSGVYGAQKCVNIIDKWSLSATQCAPTTQPQSCPPFYTGETCMPLNGNTSHCTLGGFPSYTVNVITIADIQLAVNLARNASLRLVVKYTGHDFLGKSCGAGALSVWTHHLKSLRFLPVVATPSYSSPTFKLGAGRYIAGGRHSPLSPRYGLGSEQVLSVDVVLPGGRFVTATETDHTDLFFALRGGGGSTFGVVTSVTVKAHPRTSFSGLTQAITTGPDTANPDEGIFWAALEAYRRRLPEFAAAGSYGYSMIFPRRPPGSRYTWTMHRGWSVWSNTTTRDALFAAVRSVIADGLALIQYNMDPAAPEGTPPSGANTHWRDALWFAIMGSVWGDGIGRDGAGAEADYGGVDGAAEGFGPGAYPNEGDVMGPGFGGNYERLRWRVQGQEEWLTLQTGRLCKVAE
ncbi:6-hydroxy-D-nicotine oxidase [Staphylotrichum tortipilum]|uniref:6-hydroxy-D-nicotine oxidase n=1 Tax=Staphylotrichum tortipilum TaxID=2831512 RepID=A0AAN6RW09_9PEZI|nr:6-hydroxy-D-nicotine oxidase [Staphylotrichum longicolle]